MNTGFVPRRIGPASTRKGFNSPRIGSIVMFGKRMVNTEKKMKPVIPETSGLGLFPGWQRQSISERKAIPLLEERSWNRDRDSLFAAGRPSLAKKSLFSEGGIGGKDDSFEFAKPLSPYNRPEIKSRAELILMREGLMGLPRESLSALLRQSLSKAELDRMFEDDSTENFEALEKRLKTPKRAKKAAVSMIPIVSKQQQREEKEKENTEPQQNKEKEPEECVKPECIEEKLQEQKLAVFESRGGNNVNKELLDESHVVNIEVEEEEDSDDDDVFDNMAAETPPFLHKSFSTTDLPSATALEAEEKEVGPSHNSAIPAPGALKPSISAVDVTDAAAVSNVELSSFHRRVLEEHEQHVRDMEAIEEEVIYRISL